MNNLHFSMIYHKYIKLLIMKNDLQVNLPAKEFDLKAKLTSSPESALKTI